MLYSTIWKPCLKCQFSREHTVIATQKVMKCFIQKQVIFSIDGTITEVDFLSLSTIRFGYKVTKSERWLHDKLNLIPNPCGTFVRTYTGPSNFKGNHRWIFWGILWELFILNVHSKQARHHHLYIKLRFS